ncbi:MAG: hypothetical protein VW397_09350 [Candidatus Margulisiibacteriota bacterium]
MLFTTASTLICCALPALFVFLGAGSALAGLVGIFPQLIWLSKHKAYLFGIAFLGLCLARVLPKNSVQTECARTNQATCSEVKRTTNGVWWLSLIMTFIGVFFAYLLPFVLDYIITG